MLFVGCVHDGCAAKFCHFFSVTVETPATDFVRADDILDKNYTTAEAQRQTVEHFEILEEIIIRGRGIRIFIVVSINQQFDHWLSSRLY